VKVVDQEERFGVVSRVLRPDVAPDSLRRSDGVAQESEERPTWVAFSFMGVRFFDNPSLFASREILLTTLSHALVSLSAPSITLRNG